MKLIKALCRFSKEESGAAIVEYGLALLVVGAVGVGGFTLLASTTSTNVNAACVNVAGAGAGCP